MVQANKDIHHTNFFRVSYGLCQQCETVVFFPNFKANQDIYREKLLFSEREYDIIKNTPTESRQFLLRHGKESVICKFDMSGIKRFIPILSGRKETVKLMYTLIKEHGDNPDKWLPEFMQEVQTLDI